MRLLAACSPGEIRVVAAEGGTLIDAAIERPGARDGIGDLHRGRVTARRPALAGAFVALADGPEGFLPDSAGGRTAGVGDAVTVRVTRSAQGGKGPRLAVEPMPAQAGPPALLTVGPGAVATLAALHPQASVRVDDMAALAVLRPLLGERVAFVARAFDDDTEAAWAALARREVALAGGARLAIYPTPALVAIDVDLGGGASGRRGKTAAHVEANTAIIPAIAREIRLRNLSGPIVVDLAGLSPKRRAALGPDFTAALAGDPVAARFLGFSGLGLAEILRGRIRPPLHELLAGPHAAGLAALRQLARELAASPGRPPALRAAADVADAILADSAARADLARLAGRPLILHTDRTLPPLAWRLEEE